jgi:hypothetical protein
VAGDVEIQGGSYTDYVDFDTTYVDGQAEGRLQWNATDGTLEVGMPGGTVNLQIGQEELIRATNDSGGTLANGTPVYISGSTGGSSANVQIKAADADFATGLGFRTIGVTTEEIQDGQKGYVTTVGLVRDVNTDSFAAAGVPVYLAKGGGFAASPPTQPDVTYVIGVVVRKHATEGVILVSQTSLPNLDSLSNVLTSSKANAEILAWDAGDSRWENKVPTVDIPVNISMFDPAPPTKAGERQWNGGLEILDTAASVGPATPANDFTMTTKGSGKILIVVNTSSDSAGDITITGTSVDRDTMAQTASDTSVITINGVTTDGSTTDANGNIVHAFTKAYITDKWFTGVCTISTSDVTIEDMDIYHVSFEQFNDTSSYVINTLDANIFTTNASAEFDAYLFTIHVTGDECDVHNEAGLHVGTVGGAISQAAVANKHFRLRAGGIDDLIDGTTDGFWVDIYYVNSPTYVEDVTMKIWATKTQTLTLT